MNADREALGQLLARGRGLEAQGQLKEAVAVYREVVRRAPDDAGCHAALAMALHDQGELGGAIESYNRSLSLNPVDPEVLHSFGYALLQAGQLEAAVTAYRRALSLAPDQRGLRRDLAAALERLGKTSDAVAVYEDALSRDRDDLASHRQLTRLCLRAVPRWHFPMLNDRSRIEAYDRAIRRAVRPGDLVLDIGTGSGLLAMMAARAGASHVVSCEIVGPIVDVARRIVADNGLSDRITIVHKPSTRLRVGDDLPRRADVLVSEIIDAGLLGENLIPTVRHARAHLVAPDARVVPERARIEAQLVASPSIRETERVDRAAGFDVSRFNRFAVPGYLPRRLAGHDHRCLSDPFELFSIDLAAPPAGGEQLVETIRPAASGTVDAVAFWFQLWLADDIVLDSGPQRAEGHWVQAVQMLPPRDVQAGAPLDLVATRDELHVAFRWADPGDRDARAPS